MFDCAYHAQLVDVAADTEGDAGFGLLDDDDDVYR
jgi:hypothetical protein